MTRIGTIVAIEDHGAGWANFSTEEGEDLVVRFRGFRPNGISLADAIILALRTESGTASPPARARIANVSPLPPAHPECARCNARGDDTPAADH